MSQPLSRRQLLASAAAAPASLAQRSQAGKPNILLLVSDDHTAEFTGCYGNPTIRTPNLDKFASQGMLCEKMFTAAPQCVPSRASFMTGISPVAARMSRFSAALPREIKALPEYLREAGYFTGIAGRNHHLDGSPNGKVSGPIYQRHNLSTFKDRVDFLDVSEPPQYLNRINAFFDQRPESKPFFLWFNFRDPHYPWDSNAIAQPHDPARIRVPDYLPDLKGVRSDLRRYYDEIARLDEDFGKIMSVLEKRGLTENTLVLFIGDNGIPMPHGKGTLYDPGLHVPCIARWPGRIQPDSRGRELLSGEDLTPTFLEAAGLSTPESMSGRSFLSMLTGRAGNPREYIFGARVTHGNRPFKEGTTTHTFDLSRCVRSDRYKLIYNYTPQQQYSPVDSYNDPGWVEMVDEHMWGRLPSKFDRAYFAARPVIELYDLQADPIEFNNIAGKPELAQIQRQLTEKLQEKMILDWDYLPLPLNE
jgi:arylsulfatase A-like enzyme